MVVAEGLLALAKDSRYIQSCQELLYQVIESDNAENKSQKTLLFSTLLYFLFTTFRRRKTLGMERMGLSFANFSYSRLLLASVGSALAAGALLQWKSKQSRTDDELRGRDRVAEFHRRRHTMIQGAQLDLPGWLESAHLCFSFRVLMVLSLALNDVWSTLSADNISSYGPHEVTNGRRQCLNLTSWLFRMHIVMFCLNGKYVSLLQRFSGFTFEGPKESSQSSQALSNTPKTVKLIGVLLLLQLAGGTLRFAVARLMSLMLNRKSTIGARDEQMDSERNIQGGPSCGICHGTVKHATCIRGCGHVFCWACLQHWLGREREECPACRKKATYEDILPLYNY